jgi:arylformamidase
MLGRGMAGLPPGWRYLILCTLGRLAGPRSMVSEVIGVAGRRVIDLSLTLGGPLISALPGVPTFEKQPVHTHQEHGRSNTRLAFNIHTATHVDCPYHFAADGATVDQMPLEAYMGAAVRADVRELVGPGEGVTVEHFRRTLPAEVPLSGTIVIVHTGWLARAWGRPNYYLDNSYLTEDAARWLVAEGIKAVGVDCSVERAVGANPPRHGDSPVHRILLPAGVMLIENLANLDQLPRSGFELWALPIKVFEGDGAPCRAVAVLD